MGNQTLPKVEFTTTPLTVPMNKLALGAYAIDNRGRLIRATVGPSNTYFYLVMEDGANFYYPECDMPVTPLPEGSVITITI